MVDDAPHNHLLSVLHLGATWGHGVSAVALFLTQPRTMINMGVVMGVGVVGVGSEILDPSDDDDDDDGLPRTKKERSAEAPRPMNRAVLADQFDVRRKAVFLAAV